MLTTGSKLLIGAGAAATVGALLYGLLEGGAMGTVGLTFAAAVLFFLGGVTLYTRDANVSSMDVAAHSRSAAAAPAPGASMWPAVAAVGGVLLIVGLVSYPVVFIFGVLVLLAATVEWMVEAWSERASGDAAFNQDVRARIAHPLELPLLAVVGLGVIVYSFSRIMLFLSKTSGPVVFGVIALLVLLAGFLIAFRPGVRSGALGAVAAIAALGLVAGGVATAIGGERDIEVHETTGSLAEHGECDTADETHADDNASQTVAATANVTAVLTLQEDGTLSVREAGIPGNARQVVITRNNPTNVLFRNRSSEPRRLLLDAGTRLEDPTDPNSAQLPNQYCTALTDEDSTQLLTFQLSTPSAALERPMQFSVPGVEDASVEVVVP